MRYWKIILSILFIALVSFFVVKSCVHKKTPAPPALTVRPPHRVIVKETKPKAVAETPPITPAVPLPAVRARMAIILDDWGNNYSLIKMAEALHRPITLSILPHLPQSRRIAEEAYNRHLGVMLHMPMQPQSKTQPLERHTIMTSSSDRTILRFLDAAIASVPHAEGVNNHQGSAATSDERVMRTMLTHLKEKNLFFVDSNVAPTTVGPRTAREIGTAFAKRDVFIDNVAKKDAIQSKLEEAGRIALARGKVVVIGHDKKVTLEALAEALPALEEKGIQLVLVKELVAG